MKKTLLSLLCAGLASLAWASDVSPQPLLPAGAEPIVSAPAPSGAVVIAGCGAPCTVKVCAPEPGVKKTEKVIYDEKCVDYCLPRCSLFSLFGGAACGCQNCGQPRTKHVLIKRIAHEECPEVKCVVREQPPCGTTEGLAPCLPVK
jgi:hypothetical protein